MDQAKLDKLIDNRAKAQAGGGEAAVEKHHAKGSYTARERINMLLDEGSFEEINMFLTHRCHDFGMEKKVFLGDGVAVGSGTIDGRLVFVFAQDATVIGGSLSETMAQKICNVMDQAMKLGAPISVIFGPCAGGAVYSPALTDFIMMTEQNSYMFITGPKVVKSVTGEDVTVEQLGGAKIHASKSGVTHFVAATEEEAIAEVRRLVSFIPQNNMEEAPLVACTDDITRVDDKLNDIVPNDPNKPYDMHEIINTIVDNGDFMEVHKDYAKNVICGFARFNGRSTGIIANQPSWLAGVLDCDASRKAARFVRFCDAFNIQILTLVDVPGFLCGTGQEYAGIIDHGAKLMFAYGEATVPKVTITVRKSYGGSHIVMSCKQLRGDMCYAWPNAEIAVMGASGAVGVLQAKAIKAIEDPEERKAFIAEKEAEYKDLFASPYQAANRGYIDDVIEPRYTRSRIIRAFEMLQTKRLTNPLKKHSNIPL